MNCTYCIMNRAPPPPTHLLVALHSELDKCGGMPLDGLGHLPLHTAGNIYMCLWSVPTKYSAHRYGTDLGLVSDYNVQISILYGSGSSIFDALYKIFIHLELFIKTNRYGTVEYHSI